MMEFVAFQQLEYEEKYRNSSSGSTTSSSSSSGSYRALAVPTYSRKFKIDWTAIGEALNRDKDVCYNKHKAVMRGQLKKGDFSEAENEIIKQKIAEWGDKGESACHRVCCF